MTIQRGTAKPVGLDVTYLSALLGDDSVVPVTLVRWVHDLGVIDGCKSEEVILHHSGLLYDDLFSSPKLWQCALCLVK